MKNACVVVIACILLLAAFNATGWAQIENLHWGVKRIRADQVWDTDMWPQDFIVDPDGNAGQGVCVAVIDTGIANHPDLAGRVVDGISYGGGEYWEDYDGHGTQVAGIIAAIDDGTHLIGVAPRVSLYAVKAYSVQAVVNGINWAVDNGANMISISLATYDDYPELSAACDNAYDQGVLLIAGSGNDGRPIVMYPAAYDSVLAVGAIYESEYDYRWDLSNYGTPELEFMAPGVAINSTYPPDGYNVDSGTSFAVPHVSGAAALIFASKPDPEYDGNGNGAWDNFEVRAKLTDTALDLPLDGKHPGYDEWYGHGLVNAWWSNQRPQGDINYDLITDIGDLTIVCWYYGVKEGDPDWWDARRADIDIDKIVWIRDLAIISVHFGEIDP